MQLSHLKACLTLFMSGPLVCENTKFTCIDKHGKLYMSRGVVIQIIHKQVEVSCGLRVWPSTLWDYEYLPGTLRPTIYQWMEMVISNHFLYKDLVHHPIDSHPFNKRLGYLGITYIS